MIARAAAKPSRCFCYAWIAVGPIEAVAGVRACLASLDNKKGSVPVMLDLVLFRMSVAYQNSKHSNQPFDVLRKGWCSASFIALPSELGRELFDRLKRLLSNQFPFPVAGLSLKDANWVRPEIKALVRYLVGSR